MLKKMLISLLAVFVSTILPFFAYGSEDVTRVWTIYLAVPPSFLYCRKLNGEYIDITKYKYPLYVGCIYTDGSGILRYKCLIPGAQRAMEKWVTFKNSITGKAVITFGPPDLYKSANLGDNNYEEIAASDLSLQKLVAIKITPGKIPDDSWVPQFKYQYAVDFLDAKKINTECASSLYPKEVYRQLNDIFKDYSEAFTIIN